MKQLVGKLNSTDISNERDNMFFDLNIRGASLENNFKLAKQASSYGWDHINFSYNQNDFKNALDLRDELDDSLDGIIDFEKRQFHLTKK